MAPNFIEKSISGHVSIRFIALPQRQKMQIDLQEPMLIDSFYLVRYTPGKKRDTWQPGYWNRINRDGNTWLTDLPALAGSTAPTLVIYYRGRPGETFAHPWNVPAYRKKMTRAAVDDGSLPGIRRQRLAPLQRSSK